jgi:hypothetical protein
MSKELVNHVIAQLRVYGAAEKMSSTMYESMHVQKPVAE